MREFLRRHREWSPDRDEDELLSDIMGCLNNTKKTLQVNVKGKSIFAEIEPEHHVEDLIAKFLSLQFPAYYVIIESSRGTYVAGNNVSGVVRMRMKKSVLVKELNRN